MKICSKSLVLILTLFGISMQTKAQYFVTENFQDTATTTTVKPIQKDSTTGLLKNNFGLANPQKQIVKPLRLPKPKPIVKEFGIGASAQTDGWSAFINRGVAKSEDNKTIEKFYDVNYFQFEIQEHKHPKERKENYPNPAITDLEKPKPYIYAKINNFYAMKLGFGHRKMIAGKAEQGTVSIHWSYIGGLSAGLLKPYYVDAYVPLDPNSQGSPFVKKQIKYDDNYKSYYLNKMYIVGSSGWAVGLNEIKIVPGAYVKSSLHFDFAAHKTVVLAVETGINMEYYTQPIDLMATQDTYPYFVGAFVAVQFGKRW